MEQALNQPIQDEDDPTIPVEDQTANHPVAEVPLPEDSMDSEETSEPSQSEEEPYGIEWKDWGEEGAGVSVLHFLFLQHFSSKEYHTDSDKEFIPSRRLCPWNALCNNRARRIWS